MPTSYPRAVVRRALAVAALVAAVLLVLYFVVLRPGGTYTVHAVFRDAGQLVVGDLVEVGGRNVGTVSRLQLTRDGLADVVLHISAGEYDPLHEGTQARIRAPGLAGVTNRYVDLTPGPDRAGEIPDGGSIPLADTHGIVDLDMLLDSVDPATRRQLQGIFRNGAHALAAPADDRLNEALHYLNPALSQTSALGDELTSDQTALQALIANAADVSTTLAARQDRLGASVTDTASVLRELAAHRDQLADALGRAPGVLGQARGVLRRTRGTLAVVDPFLRALRPVAPRLGRLLRQILPAARNTIPAVHEVRALLPGAERALSQLPPAARTGVPAMRSATSAIRASQPIVTGLLPYAPDLIGGFFNGFGGNSSGYYDANGHYARVSLQVGQEGGTGILSTLPGFGGPGFTGLRTGLLARCPGGAAEPAADGSNPYVPPDIPNLCDPKQDHQP